MNLKEWKFPIPKVYHKWLAVLALCIVIMAFVTTSTADTPMSVRESIASRYGMNPVYLQSSSYPGAHTVHTAKIHIALFPGVNELLIREAIKGVNPFYQFDFIDYRTAKYFYRDDRGGLIYSGSRDTMVISVADNPVTPCESSGTTHGTAYLGVQLWIKRGDNPSVEYMTYLIQHELDHLYGLPCNPHPSDYEMKSGNYTSENITARYTEESKTWGTVTVNVLKGNDPAAWSSWVVYI